MLPAFETAPLPDTDEAHALARAAASQSKEGLLKMVEKGQLWQFALKIFKAVSTDRAVHSSRTDAGSSWTSCKTALCCVAVAAFASPCPAYSSFLSSAC